jgi:CarboxypepD_reg-like domain/TonB-dependent Receptor Plug Domain
MNRYYAVALLLVTSLYSFGQAKHTVSGYLKDSSDGEKLIGATIYVLETKSGTATNAYGFYSLTLPSGDYTLEFSYIGFEKKIQQISLTQNQQLDVELTSEARQLQELTITSEGENARSQNLEMSVSRLDISTIQKMPAFLGEVDIIKSLQSLPGVSTVGEGAAGFNVRGGSVGQNLILLDEAPVYNSSHMLGFFSTFNPDAVKDTRLFKGAIPAKYGGRLASILDVRMKDGNNKAFETTGGIGTIFSRLSFEGPIVKEKGSFIVSGRRSYIDILARPFVEILKDGGALNFYDLTTKANYKLNDRNHIYLSGYFGRDNFFFDKQQGFSWGNSTATLRWNHLFSDKLFANVSGVFSNYNYRLQFGEDDRDKFRWTSSISNYIIKPEFSFFINSNNELNFGADLIYYTFNPANALGVSNGDAQRVVLAEKYNLETALFINNSIKVNPTWSIDYGVRYSDFRYFGPGTAYVFGDTTVGVRKPVEGEIKYKKGESIAHYNYLEPRFSTKVSLSESSSIKASYNRMVQYLHLISNTTASNPLDVWTPSSNNIKPEIGDQYTAGYFWNINKTWEFSAEVYYRKTQNQVDYIDGADLLINEFLEGDLLSGKGRAYGLELYLQKKTGKFNGWVSYTLGRTELKVDGINNGAWYAARYDQLHNLKITGFYDVSKRLSLSGNFVLTSGTPTTFPTSYILVQGILVPYNADGSRNNVRLPAYHRLDISARLEGKEYNKHGKKRKNTDYWVFSIYNVYGRRNPFSIYFSQADERFVPGQAINTKATQLSIIGSLVPSVSYNFKF